MLLALAACTPAAKPERVYVTNEFSGDLSIVDVAKGAVVSTVRLGKRPRGMAFSPDGRKLYVALTGSPVAPPGVDESKLPPPDRAADGVGVVDLETGQLERTLRGISDPEQLASDASGRIYSASEDAQAVEILDNAGGRLASIPLGRQPEGVALRPGGGVLYVTLEDDNAVAVVDLAAGKVTGQVPVGGRPRSIAFTPDGARAFVTNETGSSVSVLDAKAHRKLFDIALSGQDVRPMGVVVSPDGKRAYVTTGRGGTLVAIDASAGKVLGQARVGGRPWGVAITRDGSRLITANGGAGDVAVVDASILKVLSHIKVGERPWGASALH